MAHKPFKITKQEPAQIDNKDVDCETVVSVEIPHEEVALFRGNALASLGTRIKLDGFREGKIPEKVLIDRLGEIAIMEEAGQLALEKHYNDILVATELKPISSPKVLITKVAPGEPFELKMNIQTLPEVKLAAYEKLAKEAFSLDKKSQEEAGKRLEVTEAEIDAAIKDMQEQAAHQKWHDENPHDHAHDHGRKKNDDGTETGGLADQPLPEVNEEFIRKFGPFNTVEEFRAKIRESMGNEKARKEVEIARLKLMETLIEKSDIKLPRIMIDSEINRMIGEMTSQISQMGLKLDDYLKHIGKTEEDMRKDAEPDALKRAKTQVIMNEIAVKEKLEPKKEDLDKEVAALMAYYKDADKTRATIYVEQFMTNDLVWKFLENAGR
jgi:trigger factor